MGWATDHLSSSSSDLNNELTDLTIYAKLISLVEFYFPDMAYALRGTLEKKTMTGLFRCVRL